METIIVAVSTKWNVEQLNGYKPISTFWDDFSIADAFGCSAISDTYKSVFAQYRNDYKMLTELVLVLNHKIWQHYEQKHENMSKLYNTLWEHTDIWAQDNLKGDELSYYYRVTD